MASAGLTAKKKPQNKNPQLIYIKPRSMYFEGLSFNSNLLFLPWVFLHAEWNVTTCSFIKQETTEIALTKQKTPLKN